MTVYYPERLQIITDKNPISNYDFLSFANLPDQCPVCSFAISPEYFLIYAKSRVTTEILCGCPRQECASIFIARYIEKSDGVFKLVSSYPSKIAKKEFPEEVETLSKEFVAIYNQALQAEKQKLDLICGGAYRKALEYLIKDYVIKINPEEETRIKSMHLQQCIQKYITEPSIREIAERAVWLGNDETHYVRKWADRDIKDLKNLIDLTVYFISMSIKASRYMEEMVRK
jgi:hypothetical protein